MLLIFCNRVDGVKLQNTLHANKVRLFTGLKKSLYQKIATEDYLQIRSTIYLQNFSD